MLLRFKTRMGKLLHEHDEAREAFEREFDIIHEAEKEKCNRKATGAFMAGAIVSAGIYALVFIQLYGKGGL